MPSVSLKINTLRDELKELKEKTEQLTSRSIKYIPQSLSNSLDRTNPFPELDPSCPNLQHFSFSGRQITYLGKDENTQLVGSIAVA